MWWHNNTWSQVQREREKGREAQICDGNNNSSNKKPWAAFKTTLTGHKQQAHGDCVCRWKEHLNLILWPLVIVPHCLLLTAKCLPSTLAAKTLQERKHLPLTHFLFHISWANKSIGIWEPIDQPGGVCVCALHLMYVGNSLAFSLDSFRPTNPLSSQ